MSTTMFTEKALLIVSATTQFELFSVGYFLTKMNVYEYQLFYTVTARFSVYVISIRIVLILLTNSCFLEYQLLLLYKVFLALTVADQYYTFHGILFSLRRYSLISAILDCIPYIYRFTYSLMNQYLLLSTFSYCCLQLTY